MSDIFCDCLVCDGYEEYGGQPCTFCEGGGHQLAAGSYESVSELAEKYKKFIDNGGKSEDWND